VPLSEPKPREPIHTRTIILNGYEREDGLFDIEAHLTDTKPWRFDSEDRGFIEAGEPLHGMWVRMTVNEKLVIVACEAATDHSPYAICPSAAPNFARLAGLQIRAGFLKEANSRVGGTVGCTHLRELLQQMATTAYQALYPVRARRQAERGEEGRDEGKPALLDTCIAYGTESPVVLRKWPHLYTGPETRPAAAEG
jgi:hypothetical protein